MARGRMVNQTIDYDPEFNALGVYAQLLYLRALAFLDRDGLITGHPHALIGKIAPLMPELVQHTSGVIQEWVRQGLVILYTTKSGDVLFFKGFGKNQSGMHYDRETPSRFPPPPGWTYGPKGLVIINSGVAPDEVRQESGISPAQIEVKDQIKDQELQGDEEEDTHARDPIADAWQECYAEPIPKNLSIRIAGLVTECGADAVVYAIHASKEADARNFRYIAQCARNYLPPAPNSQNSHYTNGAYHVDIPGVVQLTPAPVATAPPPLPPPMNFADPWAVALVELQATLSPHAAKWLTGSELSANGELAGVPFYRLRVACEPDRVEWLRQQAEPAIRRKICSIVGKRVEVEIVAAEREIAP